MERISWLSFEPGVTKIPWSLTPEPSTDFEVLNPFIDGQDLIALLKAASQGQARQKCSPFSTCLISPRWEEAADELLLRAPSGFPSGRVGVLACCGCLAVSDGSIGPLITAVDGRIVWHDFANEVYFGDDEKGRKLNADLYFDEPFKDIGPFTFDRRQYEEAIRAVLGHPLRARAKQHL